MSSINPLPLFYDVEGKRPVPYAIEDNKVTYEAMMFSSLDEGEEAVTHFYVRNASMGVIEDFVVEVKGVDKESVTVELTSASDIQRMAVLEMYEGTLLWRALEGVKAGSCMAHVAVEGMLTQE